MATAPQLTGQGRIKPGSASGKVPSLAAAAYRTALLSYRAGGVYEQTKNQINNFFTVNRPGKPGAVQALREALREELGRMLEKRFGGGWPRRWMEEPAMLEHRMDEWEKEWFRQGREESVRWGREEGRAEERALASRRFGADTAETLVGLLEGVDDADRLAEVGEMIVDCGTGSELLGRVERT